MNDIKRVAVIGGGIMGGGIAAFFANLGIKCDLYDLDMKIIENTLKKLTDPKAKIPILYTHKFIKRITPRSSSDFDKYLKDADLIVEAVPEKMEIKQSVFGEVDKFRREDAIVATNTSGLSINEMTKDLSDNMKEHFIGVHYFNPVRFMALVEIIPAEKTKKEIVDFLYGFYQKIGKKPIICKDKPNFVANRIGVYALMKVLQLMEEYGFDVEMIDMLTGTAIGSPKTATLRLCDMVGIETVGHVALNVVYNCPEDECKEIFKPLPWLKKMIAEGMHGEKTKQGFYKKTKDRKILALDLKDFEYKPLKNPKNDVVRVAKGYQKAKDRIAVMCGGDTPVHRFCQKLMISTAAYSLNRVGEIADDILTIDNAMKWGFNREVGPIEVLDIFGLEKSMEMMTQMGIKIPELLKEIQKNTGAIYKSKNGIESCYDPQTKEMKVIPQRKDVINLAVLKREEKIVRENLSTRLIDLGDGVLLFEPDHKMVPTMNPVDGFVMGMMAELPSVMKKEGFQALVIGNQSVNFSAGAQIQMILELCKSKQWKTLTALSGAFQQVNMALYHAPFPVVIAPHGLTLGGGMEITLSCHRRVALAEFYGGLVEVGIGLLPGAAGNLLLLLQFMKMMEPMNPGPMPPVMKAMELIAYGTVSSSAYDAIDKGFLTRQDVVVINKDEQISKAKEVALSMVKDFKPNPPKELYLPGKGGYLVFESNIEELLGAGKLTAHSALIAKKQAHVLTGGNNASPVNPITEEEFLAIEREAFVQLCGEPKSQERIAYMLKKKKPLIN